MLEQQGNALVFTAFYTASKVGKTGLADVTVDVYEGGTLIITGDSASEIGGGLYSYTLGSVEVDANAHYYAVFKTADATVDQKHIPAMWIVGRAWVNRVDDDVTSRASAATALSTAEWTNARALLIDNLANLDASISAVLTAIAGIAAAGAAAVWGYASRTLTITAAALAAIVSGTILSLPRGDTVTISLTGLGALDTTDFDTLRFSLKRSDNDTDLQALVGVLLTSGGAPGDGLQRLNGNAPGAGYTASLTVTDIVTGTVDVLLSATVMAVLSGEDLYYDLQKIKTGVVTTLTYGRSDIGTDSDITRTTS